MSMNLHSDKFDFWQTPTEVTRQILELTPEGAEPSNMEKLQRYTRWLDEKAVDAVRVIEDRDRALYWFEGYLMHRQEIWKTIDSLTIKGELEQADIYML
jgi:hypothetical protein